MAELANAQLPDGTYRHIRIVISAAELVVNNESFSSANGKLVIDAAAIAGIQIPLPGPHAIVVQNGQVAQALLDFDVAASFRPDDPQNTTRYFMLPVIRAANLATTGSLAGVVRSDAGTPNDAGDDVVLPMAGVRVTQNGQPAGVTFSDAQGVYFIPGLPPGDVDVTFRAPGHDPLTVNAVTIQAQQQTSQDATLVKQ